MANRILLTTEQLKEQARKLDEAVRRSEDMVNKCQSVVNGLLSSWQGDAQKKFVDSWSKKRSAILKTTTAAKELANKIKAFVDRMEAAEKASARSGAYLANV